MLVIGERGLAISRLLCISAHSDDLEIGCGGTVLSLLERHPGTSVDWLVLSAGGDRAEEARASADRFLSAAGDSRVTVETFRERYFPYDPQLKEYFDRLGTQPAPDLVLVPWRGDAHQDHRTVADLAANTFRDQLILEYEIPKYDGDLGRPSVYVQLTSAQVDAKVDALMRGFATQRDRDWFTPETFRAMMRMRGIECRAPSGYAEAFHCRKLVLA
jgi:LmbE family N-acetylglucosaminyl deacetylase